MSKSYLYWEYREPYPDKPTEMTEEQILDVWWDYFKTRMDRVFGENYFQTTKEECIEDWVVINWAWPKDMPCIPFDQN